VVTQLPPYQRLVDGLLLPAAVANHPALDLCNTRAGWDEPEPREYLESYEHLVLLTREAGLISDGVAARLRRVDGGDRVLRRALELREAIYRSCTEDEAAGLVGEEARKAAAHAVLVRGGGWALSEDAGAELPVLALARSAAELIGSPSVADVGRCPGHNCGWLFLDPRGRRRWCVMEVCGNRAKARRFAAKARV
jgi:predicted RNA-binding Zn ribbon-like protein